MQRVEENINESMFSEYVKFRNDRSVQLIEIVSLCLGRRLT